MPLKVRCPACNKNVRLDDHDAGRPTVCPACGVRFAAPPAPLLGPIDPPPPAQLPVGTAPLTAAAPDDYAGFDPATFAAPTSSPGAPLAVPSRAGRGRPSPIAWVALALAAACVVGVAAALYTRGAFDGWERSHRRPITDLKAEAELLAADGRVVAALEKYDALRRMVDGRQLADPALAAAVAQAEADRRQLYASRLSQLGADRPAAPVATRPTSTAPGPLALSVAPPPPSSRPTAPVTAALPVVPAARAAPAHADAVPVESTAPTPGRPAPRAAAVAPDELTDARVGEAIRRGAAVLLAAFDPQTQVLRDGGEARGGFGMGGGFGAAGRNRGVWDRGDPAWFAGLDALAVYALLQSGQAVDDPRLSVHGPQMAALVDALKRLPIDGHAATYARGLRATALALFNRRQDYTTLADDADYLLGTCGDGAYTYVAPRVALHKRSFGSNGLGWDNSNSQYGLLGVWSAIDAEPRVEVPSAYWRAVERHWSGCQFGDGQWGYTAAGGARLTMTSAGIVSLFVAHEYLDPPMNGSSTTGREPFTPALKKALDWFEQGDHAVRVDGANHWGYALYGVERVGLASGFKHFGRHDWYRELAADVVREQNARGDWGGVENTAYALLFLSRGRHPVLMNKLRFDRRGGGGGGAVAAAGGTGGGAFWSNRPRDAANLARFAGRQLERPINWQVVSVENPWTEWADSPILYIASHVAPRLTDADYDNLRSFVEGGGLIFTHADAGAAVFNVWARELARRLFPDYPMTDLPADHPAYNVVFRPTPRPPLWVVTNGARALIVHSPTDLSLAWQNRQDRAWEGGNRTAEDTPTKQAQLAPFQVGVNLFVYAAGKRDLRNRIDPTFVAPPPGDAAAPLASVRVARLRYAGNWDPEPGAWRRYANWFRRQTGYQLDVHDVPLGVAGATTTAAPVATATVAGRLTPAEFPFAHLTGTARQAFSPAEVAALRAYVEAGGVALIDLCGGAGPFDQSARDLLTAAFPGAFPQPVSADHPLLGDAHPGMELIPRPRRRPYTVERLGTGGGAPAILRAGKGHVIVTSLDVTCGLLGTNTWGVLGYEPAYAQSLVKNALFWTLDGQPDAPVVSPPRPAEPTTAAADEPSRNAR